MHVIQPLVATRDCRLPVITATLPMSIWLLHRRREECTWARSIALLASLGLTLMSKLSVVAFLPVCGVLIARQERGVADLILFVEDCQALEQFGGRTDFNPIAGRHPEGIVVDRDLDRGQDLARLGHEVERRRIEMLYLACFGTADPKQHGLQNSETLPRTGRLTDGWPSA